MDVTTRESGGRGGRWVCPNDRHLALRAKLRTGWSVKTGSLDSRWGDYSNSYSGSGDRYRQSFVLTEEEQQTIIEVIKRAEILDLSEQERVGRLVERLENMKRNVCIVTSNRSNERRSCGSRCSGGARCVCSCALCGEKFGAVLGATPSLCKDCRKYICQKCGIEAGPNSTLSSNASLRGATSTTAATAVRLAKEKMPVQRIVHRSSGSAQKQFLCRICAETREMWKKSGAWFFKGMPKYVLPEKKERGWSRMTHRTSAWSVAGNSRKSLESAEGQDSSSDDDATRRLAARTQSTSSTNSQANRDASTFNKISNSSNSQVTGGSSKSNYRGQSRNGLSPSGYREEPSDKLDRSTLSIPSQCSRLSPTGSVTTIRSRTSGRNGSYEQRVSFEDEVVADEKANDADDDDPGEEETQREVGGSVDRSKGSQVQSLRRNSAMSTNTTISSAEKIQEGSRSCSDQESYSSGTRNSSLVDLPRLQTTRCSQGTEQDYGTLEVSLRYDPAAQCLQCKVERARGLKPMDIHGLADPFCKLNILPVETGTTSRRLRTKTVHKTRDPEFNEMVNFYGTTESDMTSGKALHVLILQDDSSGQDFLGEARFFLNDLQPYQKKRYIVPLQEHYLVDKEEETWGVCSSGRGQIQVSLSYCTRRRALLVTVHRAANLLPMDSNGFSDPFVKLCLIEDATDNHRQQRILDYSMVRGSAKKLIGKKSAGRNSQNTSVKWKTLNPEWNEEFVFGTRLTDLTKMTLCLSVWDKDFGKSNDYLGGLALGCNSKGARLRHWTDTIRFPDHRHWAWHDLTDSLVPAEQ